MYTQCPECMTVFALDAETIAQAHGCVGCGSCGATFDTMATLADELPAGPFETLELNHPSAEPPLLVQRVAHEAAPQQSLFEPQWGPEPEHDRPDPDDDEGGLDPDPDPDPDHRPAEFEQAASMLDPDPPQPVHHELDLDAEIAAMSRTFSRRERMGGPLRKRLIMGCVGLAVCLALQLAWAERAALARNPTTGTLVRGLCDVFHCRPAVKDLKQLELLSRDVRKHPSVANALIISATMRNNAAFAQPFPIVTISLSDLDDNRVAMRRFRPAEYLHDAEVRAAGLAPGASTALVFEVQDPGQNAVAFEFSFE